MGLDAGPVGQPGTTLNHFSKRIISHTNKKNPLNPCNSKGGARVFCGVTGIWHSLDSEGDSNDYLT
jgi:hypothetical protein